MTLTNLVGSRLDTITPDALMIQKLLQAAATCLADASVAGLSNENRFDIAYKAVMQLANAALQANGFRTLTSVPGHHQTMIQSLPKTVGLASHDMIELDALRKQRNITDYSGDLVSDQACEACQQAAKALSERVNNWIAQNKPELLQ